MKHLAGVMNLTSDACPVHGGRRGLVQVAELHLYGCVCSWDQCTRAQLAVPK